MSATQIGFITLSLDWKITCWVTPDSEGCGKLRYWFCGPLFTLFDEVCEQCDD